MSDMHTRRELAAYHEAAHAVEACRLGLSVDGVAIIAHGGSSPVAIKNAIRAAQNAVEQDINRRIVEVLSGSGEADEKKAEGLQKLWHRLRSKMDSLGDKAGPPSKNEERKQGGKG